jgi:hypothetical protein
MVPIWIFERFSMVILDPIEEAVLAWVHGIALVFDRNHRRCIRRRGLSCVIPGFLISIGCTAHRVQ